MTSESIFKRWGESENEHQQIDEVLWDEDKTKGETHLFTRLLLEIKEYLGH